MNFIKHPRSLLLLIILNFVIQGLIAQAATLNYKPTSWKTKSTWIDGYVPGDTDHVVLINDITIDTNAVCRSLTTNGWNVTILPGYTLQITGNDSLQQPDGDSLVSALVWRRYVSEKDSININTYSVYKTFEYDSLKRIRLIVTKEDFADNELQFYYMGSSSLPYKTIKYDPCDYLESNECIIYTDTSFYQYDSLGRMIRDSTKRWISNAPLSTTSIDNYQYDGNQITKIHHYNSAVSDAGSWHLSAFTTDTLRAFQTMLLPNAFSQQAFILPVQAGSYSYQYSFFLDEWENPLFRTSILYPIVPQEQLFFDFPEMKHNKTVYSYSDSFGYNTYQLSYRYRSDKLPTECILYSFYNDPGTIYSLSYEYIH